MHRALKNSLTIYGFQILTTVFQFGYAAYTSRSVGPSEFGYYSASLATISLFSILATSGLAEDEIKNGGDATVTNSKTRASKALILGFVFALLFVSSSQVLLFLWKIPSTPFLLSQIALTIFVLPLQAHMNGIYSRDGLFRFAATLSFFASIVAMAATAFWVLYAPTGESLLLVSTLYALIFVGVSCLRLRHRIFPLQRIGKRDFSFRHFTGKLFFFRTAWYLNSNLLRWGLMNFGQPSSLGQLNRGEVVSVLPIQQIQMALSKPIYPSFARKICSPYKEDFRETLTRGLSALAILSFPLICLGAGVLPPIIMFLLGDKWDAAATSATVLLIGGAFQLIVAVFSIALELNEKFMFGYVVEIILFATQITGLLLYVLFGSNSVSLEFVVVALSAVMALRFFAYASYSIKVGIVSQTIFLKRIIYAVVIGLILVFLTHFFVAGLARYLLAPKALAGMAVALAGFAAEYVVVAKTRFGKKLFVEFTNLL